MSGNENQQRPIDAARLAVGEMSQHVAAIMNVLSNPLDLNEKQRLTLVERVTGMQVAAANALLSALLDHETQLEQFNEKLESAMLIHHGFTPRSPEPAFPGGVVPGSFEDLHDRKKGMYPEPPRSPQVEDDDQLA